MPRHCTACGHPEREAIDAAIAAGESYRTIAAQFGLSPSVLTRHKAHIAAAIAHAQSVEAIDAGRAILAKIAALEADAKRLQDAAERAGDLRTAIAAVREMRGIVELLAKLQGEPQEGPAVNIVLSPEWLAVRAAVMGALAEYPEARARVVEALARVGA